MPSFSAWLMVFLLRLHPDQWPVILLVVVPIVLGESTYKLFNWLDKIVSREAKTAISDWLQPAAHDWLQSTEENRKARAAAILELFDRVYVPAVSASPGSPYWKPLWTWWALVRSSIITTVVTVFVTYTSYVFQTSGAGGSVTLWPGLLVNIVSDYLALHVIRMWLLRKGIAPWQALWIAPSAGLLLVISFTGLRLALYFAFIIGLNDVVYTSFPQIHLQSDMPLSYIGIFTKDTAPEIAYTLFKIHWPWGLAALLVHLWLPLFALCIFTFQSLYDTLRAVKAVERLLEGNHPLLALGIVATPLVFVVTGTIAALVWWLVL